MSRARSRGRSRSRSPSFDNPMNSVNQMTRATTGMVIGAGSLMLGFGALNMIGGSLGMLKR